MRRGWLWPLLEASVSLRLLFGMKVMLTPPRGELKCSMREHVGRHVDGDEGGVLKKIQ